MRHTCGRSPTPDELRLEPCGRTTGLCSGRCALAAVFRGYVTEHLLDVGPATGVGRTLTAGALGSAAHTPQGIATSRRSLPSMLGRLPASELVYAARSLRSRRSSSYCALVISPAA
jgi:hypothetical protein